MSKLDVSFQRRRIDLTDPIFALDRQEALRFEWIALLAYRRKTERHKQPVTISEIQRLPKWENKTPKTIVEYCVRYISAFERKGLHVVDHKKRTGPYRLLVDSDDISFDLPLHDVRRELRIAPDSQSGSSVALYLFTRDFCKAMDHYFHGRLQLDESSSKPAHQRHARRILYRLAGNEAFDPSLRAFAHIWCARLLDRVGNYTGARLCIGDCENLLANVDDPVLRGNLCLVSAWQYFRSGNKTEAEEELRRARSYAEMSFDQGLWGGVEDRLGFHLSKFKQLHDEALLHRMEAVKVRLFAGDFERLQVSCHNLGETLECMGKPHYPEAKKWLTLGGEICRRMCLGLDRALAEIELARIALAENRLKQCDKLLAKAYEVFSRSGNELGRVHYCLLHAELSHKRRRKAEARDHLINARKCYMSLRGFDTARRDRELHEKFPEYCSEVFAATQNVGRRLFQSVR